MRPYRITVACALSALLAACGASAPPAPGGDAGTPDRAATSPAAGAGEITGLDAGLVVDGVAYDVGGATVAEELDPASPLQASLEDLKLGQHVDLELAGTCRLSHVAIGATVVGLIDPGSIDTAARRFTVLAQPVSFAPAVVGTTVGRPTLFVGVRDAAGLAAGQLVKVHGPVDGQGVIAARLVVVMPEKTPLLQRVSGVVSGADAGAKTFKLGALTVDHGAAKVLPADARIADGEAVVVFSRKAATGTAPALTLPADTVRVRHAHRGAIPVRLGGPIVSVTPVEGQAVPNFALHGVKVDAARATLAGGTEAGDLVVGAVVRVEGTLAGGVLTATEIALLAEPVQRQVVLAGQVSSYVSVSSFVVRGTTVDASAATFTDGSSAAQLADGVHVVVLGHVSGAGVVADRVTVQPPPEAVELTLTGVVSGYDPDAASTSRTFRLAGTEVRLDPDVAWTGGTASDLVDGALVRVTGAFERASAAGPRPARPIFVATAIRFLGEELVSRKLHLGGVISGVTADAFVLNNVTVQVTSATEICGGPLANGQHVDVVARRDASGATVALEVRVFPDPAARGIPPLPGPGAGGDALANATQFTGPVSAIISATQIKVNAQRVDVSRATFRPEGRSAQDLAVGKIVTVGGTMSKGVLTATVVTILE